MSKNYTLNEDGSFLIKDYNKTSAFSNFLPGIAGEWGMPLWVFYVNRGQGVVSFGIQDKDHSILEFYPANKAYSFSSSLGFRTFIKVNKDKFYEPFNSCSNIRNEMVVSSSSLELKETNQKLGLETTVKYFTLPNTSVAALVRLVTVKNISRKNLNIELLDGLSKIIPFGSAHNLLKDMSRTLEAWMQAKVEGNLATFNLIVDPSDVSHTRFIQGANFHYSFLDKKLPTMIVDPSLIFSHDTSCSRPIGFIDKSFRPKAKQITVGRSPSSFSYVKFSLSPGKQKTLYNIFGASFKKDLIRKNVKAFNPSFIKSKEKENQALIETIKKRALSVSGSESLDQYVQSTYLDNVLRGGYPYFPENPNPKNHNGKNNHAYYIFSRKHGDLERDYNYFNLLPSYFSEGQGNYRDVNQNRRMDLFFNPSLVFKNIVYFFNFLKIDGYNPLVIQGEKLYFEKQRAKTILLEFKIKDQRLINLMVRGFYLGEFFKLLEEEQIKVRESNRKKLVSNLLLLAKRQPQASHGEGYWIDHWRYNLDLIESFLYFYPDKLKELFLTNGFTFWDDEYRVRPRSQRYLIRRKKVYQGESVEAVREKRSTLKERKTFKNFIRTRNKKIYKTNLVSKVLVLILNKLASLDPDGIGIEMEAGKPGWCDSLNGLPALFGSSLCETLELKRASQILLSVTKELHSKGVNDVEVAGEIYEFLDRLHPLVHSYFKSKSKTRDYDFWDRANSVKEEFRKKTFFHLSGRNKRLTLKRIEHFLHDTVIKLNTGIGRAKLKKDGIYTTYFTYDVKKYSAKNSHIVPTVFNRHNLPISLEGVVSLLRVEGKKSIISSTRKSRLYDKTLKMYRLNDSLKNESLEIGRSRVFVPGWLENESIWLHMEYKYILEMLKNGFYEDFYRDFHNCAVCFFDPKRYGRNILENSSFIVSSVFPDENLWGKGYVARLSGATAELINIWILLCLGHAPFSKDRKGLTLTFKPLLKKELFTKKAKTVSFLGRKITIPANTFSFVMFSKTLVCYHNHKRKDTYSKGCSVEKIIFTLNNKKVIYYSDTIKAPHAQIIRKAGVQRIDVFLT